MNLFSYSTVRNPSNPCQLRSLTATLCQQTAGCHQPFSHGMKGLVVYERVCLGTIFDPENFRAIIEQPEFLWETFNMSLLMAQILSPPGWQYWLPGSKNICLQL